MEAALSVLSGGDDDVDSVSPRTLRQAADRLARFTSDLPAGVFEPVAHLLTLSNPCCQTQLTDDEQVGCPSAKQQCLPPCAVHNSTYHLQTVLPFGL